MKTPSLNIIEYRLSCAISSKQVIHQIITIWLTKALHQ